MDPSVQKLRVEADKNLPACLSGTFVRHGELGFYEDVVDGPAPFDDLPDTDAQGDIVIVVFEVVLPDRGGTKVGAVTELVEREGLECPGIHPVTVAAARETGLPCQQIAVLEFRRAGVEEDVGKTRRPFFASECILACRRCRYLRADTKAQRRVACIDEVGSEDVQVADTGLFTAVWRCGKRVYRQRGTQKPVRTGD